MVPERSAACRSNFIFSNLRRPTPAAAASGSVEAQVDAANRCENPPDPVDPKLSVKGGDSGFLLRLSLLISGKIRS
jgi:hypothetical protein